MSSRSFVHEPRRLPESIVTGRLHLRPFVSTDLGALHRAIESSPHFAEFQDLSEYEELASSRERRGWLLEGLQLGQRCWESGTEFVYAVLRGNRFQGCVNIAPKDQGIYEFGYWVRRTALGKGIAFEACSGMLRASLELEDLQLVEAHTDSANLRSRNLLARLGLSLTEKRVPNASPGTSSTGFDEVWAIRRRELEKKLNSSPGLTSAGPIRAQEQT